ncbi:hypothetical protein E2C01_057442 [Portunus trituberculatus]|uniref:Uncharacterized protein n=1 Tax=Portunus trituberculatus TaxID=210409 RepID=A0A5B7H004_PORTR|nr:hypothetical protein [Portunus trituberculatus]
MKVALALQLPCMVARGKTNPLFMVVGYGNGQLAPMPGCVLPSNGMVVGANYTAPMPSSQTPVPRSG